MSNHGWRVIQTICKNELSNFWSKTIENLKKKMDHWVSEMDRSEHKITEIYRDILISEEKLRERFGIVEPEPLIYGGLEVSDNVKKFLILPSKLKLYGKFNKLTKEIRAECESVKTRWNRCEREERSNENEEISNDKLRVEKDAEY